MSRTCILFLLMLGAALAANAQQQQQPPGAADELWAAARKGDAAAVEALLSKGTDVNAKFRYGATALSYAADKGHTEVIKVLLAHGADVNVRDTFYKMTPIMWAAEKGHKEIVRMLFEKGATGVEDVLQTGVGAGHVEIVRLALARGGVKPEVLSEALVIADRNKNAEVADALKRAGAVPPPKADFRVDAKTLESYAGSYKSEAGSEVSFAVKDGVLTLTPAGQGPLKLGATDPVTFKSEDFPGMTIVFQSAEGKTVGFTFKRGTTSTTFKKLEHTKP